jgi:hypothetical protein
MSQNVCTPQILKRDVENRRHTLSKLCRGADEEEFCQIETVAVVRTH